MLVWQGVGNQAVGRVRCAALGQWSGLMPWRPRNTGPVEACTKIKRRQGPWGYPSDTGHETRRIVLAESHPA